MNPKHASFLLGTLLFLSPLFGADIAYLGCESWARQNRVFQSITPYADEGTVYPLRQNQQYLLAGGLRSKAKPQELLGWLERDWKAQKIRFERVRSSSARQTQWLLTRGGEATLITLSAMENGESQLQFFTDLSDPAFANDFPSIVADCPSLDSLPGTSLFQIERFDSHQSNLTQLLEFPESIEQTLPRVVAHFTASGWTPVATPVHGQNGSVLMLFTENRNSILITLLERNGKTMFLSNVHPRQGIPHFKIVR